MAESGKRVILQEGLDDTTTPLLGPDSSPTTPSTSTTLTWATSRKWLTLSAISIYILTIDLGFYLTAAPQMEIFQDIICSRQYSSLEESRTTGEDPCKPEAVQTELALVYGWLDTFTVLPGVLLSVPFGVLANRWGRKPILKLGLVGFLLGDVWVRVVSLVMIADVCSEGERANVLFYINAVIIIAEILAIPLSAYLMSFSPWLPYTLGFLVEIIGALLVLFLPETLWIANQKLETDSWDAQGNREEVHPVTRETTAETVLRLIRNFRNSTHFIWNNMNVMLILAAFFVATISKQSTGLFLQYTSKKFHWSIARASLLVVVRGIATLINFLLLMPAISFLITKYLHWHPKWKDLRLSQGTGLLAILGFTTMALATGPAVLISGLVALSLGSAFAITSRSLVTSLVSANHVGTLYSAAAVMQSLGSLIAGPLFAYSFGLGLRLGKGWLGLPFLQAGLLFGVVFVAVSFVRLGGVKRGITADDLENGDLQDESERAE